MPNMANNPEQFLQITKGGRQRSPFIFGEVTSGSPLKIKPDGYNAALTKSFKKLSSYTPVVGDRVIIAVAGHSHVVLGKVE